MEDTHDDRSRLVRVAAASDRVLARVADVFAVLLALGILSAGSGALAGVAPLLIVGVAVVAISILVVLARRVLGLARRYRRRRRQHAYTLLSKHLVYEYSEGRSKMVQIKRFRIRANRDGVQVFEDRYRWSGSGDVDLHLIQPGRDRSARLDGPWSAGTHREVQEDMWCRYEVAWAPSLSKGQELEIEVRWDLDNSTGDAQDFYATTVDFPTRELSMEVNLPPDQAATWVSRATYEYFTATQPLDQKVERPAGGRATILRWSIRRPSLGYRYVIKWGTD